jgi:hypothetical protein
MMLFLKKSMRFADSAGVERAEALAVRRRKVNGGDKPKQTFNKSKTAPLLWQPT